MSRCYIGGPVPGRRRRPNPQTCSGLPLWNTYQGLGMMSATRDANLGRKMSKGRGRKKRLDKNNLCHRVRHVAAKYEHDWAKRHLERARVLSLQIDHMPDGPALDQALDLYNQMVRLLTPANRLELIRLEAARGVVRAKYTT